MQCDQKIEKKKCLIFGKNGQKIQNINNKDEFESPKHPIQTTFKTLKHIQRTMF